MIRVKKENHRSWFMSNYYPCEFVMNGIRYKNAEAAFQSHKVPLEERRQFADMWNTRRTAAVSVFRISVLGGQANLPLMAAALLSVMKLIVPLQRLQAANNTTAT